MLKLTYLSHSAFLLDDGTNQVIIDPFLTGNPNSPVKADSIKVQFIILSHGHGDHFGDTVSIAKRNNATIIAVNELANHVESLGLTAHNMHIGGSFNFPFGSVKFTIAHHGSATNEGKFLGPPAGIIIRMGGKTVYHTGDTGLFYDMKLIGEYEKVDIMLLPIGDNFTMGIDDAVKAVEFVKPKLAIPMHYNTFPVIETNPEEFREKVIKAGFKAEVMDYGQTLTF